MKKSVLLCSMAEQRTTSMRQVHRAGEKLSVDYAGQTIPVADNLKANEKKIIKAYKKAMNNTW